MSSVVYTITDNIASQIVNDQNYTSIVFAEGNSCISIANNAFQNWTSLISIDFTHALHLVSIGNNSFENCPITSLSLPLNLQTLGNSAFLNCTKLSSVSFPDGLISFGGLVFSGCSLLDNIIIPSNITQLNGEFKNCVSLKNISFASSNKLTIIGVNTFYNCNNIQILRLPLSVKYILSGAFYNCVGLSVLFINAKPSGISPDAFIGCNTKFTVFYGVPSSFEMTIPTLPQLVKQAVIPTYNK